MVSAKVGIPYLHDRRPTTAQSLLALMPMSAKMLPARSSRCQVIEPSTRTEGIFGSVNHRTKVRLAGALTLTGLLERLPLEIFRRAKKDNHDEHELGWRLVLPREPFTIDFHRLRFATAEGLNLAAALRKLLGDNQGVPLVNFEFDEASQGLASSLGIAGRTFLPALGVQQLRRISAQASSAGPFVCDVTRANEVLIAARCIAECATLAIAESAAEQRSNFYDMIERVAVEALFNVHEHAFSAGSEAKWALVSLTLQPAARCLSDADQQPLEEKLWLQDQGPRMILELAITDIGNGIPRTLWRNTRDQRPDLFDAISTLGSGTSAFDDQRALLHAHLAADSFRHDSSCKLDSDFVDEYHALNWRGLYRCRQQVAEFEGLIAVASGRGRAGFAWIKHAAAEFAHSFTKANDLPGTTVLIRIGLPLGRRGTVVAIHRDADVERSGTITFNPQLLSWGSLNLARPGQRMGDRPDAGAPLLLGIVFPFRNISSHHHLLDRPSSSIPVPQVLGALTHIPPELVPILFFTRSQGENLRTVAPSWTPLTGYPRLVAIWQTHKNDLAWRVAGVFHIDTEGMLSALEGSGRYEIPRDAPSTVASLAQELALNYSGFMSFDPAQRVVQLAQFNAKIAEDSITTALDMAFADFWPQIRGRIIKDDPQRAVLLHTGTRVRRYLCVLSLVESSRLLADVLGRQLRRSIETDKTQKQCQLVTDDHGSSFVAQTLLRDVPGKITPIRREQALNLPPGSAVVLFVDAIFKGRTVTHLAEVLHARGLHVRGIVTCADLREIPGTSIGKDIKVTSLLQIPLDFRPEELGQGSADGGEVQIDRVTHMPVDAEASRFVDLHTTQGALALLNLGPNLFEHGFHERGGRLHTIALPPRRILDRHPAETARCLADKLSPFLTKYVDGKTDVAIFYRSGSEIEKHIGRLHDELVSRSLVGLGRTFQLRIPADHRGNKSVFVHADVGLFADAKPFEADQLSLEGSFGQALPSDRFIAIYVDDAAVSGKALRSFLNHVMRDTKGQPRAVMGLVLVNRLSPAELRAFDLWRKLWPPASDGSGEGVPFYFDGVFRLQVSSKEGGSPLNHPLLQRIQQSGPIPSRQMRVYVQEIIDRLSKERPVRHIFLTKTPDPERPLSPDAAQLRHLLALHQQNEAVPAEILTVFSRMRDTKDPALLHVLALEPDLLDEMPFNGICFRDTIELCVETLRDVTAARADKSDALAVLAWYETAFFDRLREIAPGILRDEALRQQFLLFVLTLFTRSKEQYHRVIDALGDVTAPAEHRAWTTWAADVITRSHRFRQTLALVQSDADAEMLVRELITRMSRHSTDAEWHWESLSNQLITMREDWTAFGYEGARAKVLRSVPIAGDLVRDVFLPALSAFVYLSELRGDNKLAERMRNSLAEAARLSEQLTKVAPSKLDEVTRERVIELCEVVESLREATWAGNWSANDVLSLAGLGEHPAPLCQALREFYSAPWAIFLRLADEIRAEARVARPVNTIEPFVIVCPVPVVEMHTIFELLLDNVRIHGEPASLNAAKRDGEPPLIITFQNRIRNPEVIGGLGVVLARAKGGRFRVDVVSHLDEANSSTWTTEITFPVFFRADASLGSAQ